MKTAFVMFPDDVNRFFSKIKKTRTCHLWTGQKDKNGYGRIKIRRMHLRAHRVAFFVANGFIDSDLYVCHTCDNPPCVNPKHLFLGTNSDNQKDCFLKGRAHDRRGEKHHNVYLTPQEVAQIRKEYVCRVVTHKMLAQRYRVSRAQVGRIVSGKRWRHI